MKGFIALSTVLVVGVVSIAIASSIALLSIGQGQSGFALTNGESTWSFIDGCAENALLKIWASPSYSGGNITIPEGTCTVSISHVGTIYTLSVSTTATNYKRTVQITLVRNATITITSWNEI